jgi:clan AA aspartic protease (TIGR02281 family)
VEPTWQQPHRSEVPFVTNESKPLLIVQGTINSKGPFNFIVDTGASKTVIVPQVARRVGVSISAPKVKALSATGRQEAQIATIDSIVIGTLEVRDVEVAVMSLATLNRSLRLRVKGIIGHNLLSRFSVTIDYPNNRIFFV